MKTWQTLGRLCRHRFEHHSELIPISEKEFRKVIKSCGIKYRNTISCEDLKAMLGCFPLIRPQRKVEITDETRFCKF